MSAIRNVGELASPYYLLEVWARREEIDIDPETYATLKRKARKLVRDARIAETRGDHPDEDWQALRRELLGVEDANPKSLVLEDGEPFEVLVWRDDDGAEALLVADLAPSVEADRRQDDAADPPSTRFELALDAYEGEADWGILITQLEIRVYRRSSGVSQQYLALDLDTLVELDDEAQWKAFAGIFRAPSFSPRDGVPLIRRIVDESRRHATKLADDMRDDVVHAAETIIQGVLDDPANAGVVGDMTRARLHDLFEETLYYLYRILFVLYAESRDVLPVSGATPYATTYSADHLVELARTEPDRADGTYYHDALLRLFGLLRGDQPEQARSLGIDPVGGELFDPERTPLLDRCRVADRYWRHALAGIALGAPDSPRRRLGRRQSFAELGVDQLGSIYEGLLVMEPYVAPGSRVLARIDGDRRILEPDKAEGLRVIRHLEAGDFALESASGRRKGSGSFYTPHEITEYLAHAALEPLIEPLITQAADDPAAAERQLLELRVCDPAMGSGAFLVQAARVLATGLARIRAAGRGERVTPDMIQRAKRLVVRTCVYGIDLNPLAVALAKVSLWLETLERGRPLTFLDARLRCGDSLVGVDFRADGGGLTARELATWPKDAVKGLQNYLKKEAGERGQPVLERLKTRKGPKKPKQATIPGLDVSGIEKALASLADARAGLVAGEGEETLQLTTEVALAFDEIEHDEDSLRNRLRAAADFWCAQWFSEGEDGPTDEAGPVIPVGVADFEAITACLLGGKPVPERLEKALEAARSITERRRFFHWALEFPEVMVERRGFDAIVGNPPWNTVSPSDREYFRTFDLQTFKKGVPKARQDERKAELRQDPEIDSDWRATARFLNELSGYISLDGARYSWYSDNPSHRGRSTNVIGPFLERAFSLLREDGRLSQVLPDTLYVSALTTGIRQNLLTQGVLERCFVLENRRAIFPIHRSVKVVLLTARKGNGPTDRFKAAFFVGKDPAGGDRAVGLEELPDVLAELDREAPELSVEQIRSLAPETWSFPELQTALDAEIVAHCTANLRALNLDERGWQLKFCWELHADKDAWRFKTADDLEAIGAQRHGLWYLAPTGTEWWPLIEGESIYHLEYPIEGKDPQSWVNGEQARAIGIRQNSDGSSIMDYFRLAWRDVASATNERSAIATVIPPRTAAKHSALTVWGGSLDGERSVALAAVISSFPFDYLARFLGKTHLTYAAISSIPCPSFADLGAVVAPAAELVCQHEVYLDLWKTLGLAAEPPSLDQWQIAERRAQIDAHMALAYGLSVDQYAAVLCTFPNLDRTQPMLPGEPKSFVTRDLALLAYCQVKDTEPTDVAKLLRRIGVSIPDPDPRFRAVDVRVEAARELGAVPYRPTPKGGRPPTDPALIEEIINLLGEDAQTAAEMAEALEEEPKVVKKILEQLVKGDEAYAEGRGKTRRYYVIEE